MILEASLENIHRAAEKIKSGGLVAFPTETVYGLGANAFDNTAVNNIYSLKKRPKKNPLITHVCSFQALVDLVDFTKDSSLALKLDRLKHFWPGPLSVVVPSSGKLAGSVSAGLPSVALRIPAHPTALSLIEESGCPIAAPSANISSYVSPTTAQHVYDEFGTRVEIILDSGACDVGIESTILSLLQENPILLRPGAITLEELRQIFPNIEYKVDSLDQLLAPGMLKEHYSPHTPMAFLKSVSKESLPARLGLISFSQIKNADLPCSFISIRVLSENGNVYEIAKHLFSALRDFDDLNLDLILIDSCPEVGIGRAIMDRLVRATAKYR